LLIDDYGHWKGQKEAVDEFFATQRFKPLLSRTDYSGRLMIKID
jgi:O-methyltransferase